MLEETPKLYTFEPKMYARYRTYLNPKADRHPILTGLLSIYSSPPNFMEHTNKIVQQKIVEALEDFFTVESLSDEPPYCSRCGAAMQYRDATFWLYGTDSAWNLRVPMCACAGDIAHPTFN